MICRDSFKGGDYKKIPQGISVLSNTKRNGRGYYIKVPKSNSVDWLKSSRKVEPVELHNSTVSDENKIIKKVKKCLRKL